MWFGAVCISEYTQQTVVLERRKEIATKSKQNNELCNMKCDKPDSLLKNSYVHYSKII